MKREQLSIQRGLAQVSIHTRHYWRVKLERTRHARVFALVSIHTRHYWRVKPVCAAGTYPNPFVSIHTRHYWRVKRAGVGIKRILPQFQSTPAITGG